MKNRRSESLAYILGVPLHKTGGIWSLQPKHWYIFTCQVYQYYGFCRYSREILNE